MRIKFADNTMLDVLSIQGQSGFIQGTTRDTLTVFVDPNAASVEKLIQIFTDPKKTKEIYEIDAAGKTINLIGTNYTIYLSVMNQHREVPVTKDYSDIETENVNIVKIAQKTYQEHLLEQILAGR